MKNAAVKAEAKALVVFTALFLLRTYFFFKKRLTNPPQCVIMVPIYLVGR